MLRLLFALLLCAAPAWSQTFDIRAGDSTLLDSYGVSVQTFLPQQTIFSSIGIANGHFRAGLSDTFEFRGWQTTVGDRLFSFTVGASGLGIAERGIAVRKQSKNQTIELFAGATGSYFSAPYFAGFGVESAGAGIFYQRTFAHGEVSTLEVIAGNKRTALESGLYRWWSLRLQGTGGLVENSRMLNAQADWQARHFALLGSHNDFVLGQQHVTADSAGAATLLGPTSLSASLFREQNKFSESGNFGLRFGPVYWHETFAETQHQPRILLHSVSERFRRFTVTESINQSAGRTGYAFGGQLRARRAVLSLDHQILFMLATGSFQQAWTATLSFRIPNTDASADVSLSRDALGHVRYGADVETFAYGHWTQAADRPHRVQSGKFMVAGLVVDQAGRPVAGAVVYIGKEIGISGSDGTFWVRCGNGLAVALRVAVDEFAAPGAWRVISAPESVQPAPEGSTAAVRIAVTAK